MYYNDVFRDELDMPNSNSRSNVHFDAVFLVRKAGKCQKGKQSKATVYLMLINTFDIFTPL